MINFLALNIKLGGKDKSDLNLNTSKKYSIGILGGTFDPPHDGHKFISKYALLKLNLHEVWWIVTYKNPLKHNSSEYFYRFSNSC